jgi:hypothetical protein
MPRSARGRATIRVVSLFIDYLPILFLQIYKFDIYLRLEDLGCEHPRFLLQLFSKLIRRDFFLAIPEMKTSEKFKCTGSKVESMALGQ